MSSQKLMYVIVSENTLTKKTNTLQSVQSKQSCSSNLASSVLTVGLADFSFMFVCRKYANQAVNK